MAKALEMYAPRAGPASVLRPRERALPPPGPGEVEVAIEAAGVAVADIVMRRGLYGAWKPPVTPGYDFVGRVVALGDGVDAVAVGARVIGVTVAGSYATRRIVDARFLAPAPENIAAPALVAAALNGVTAWQMLHRIAQPSPGESILVHGAAGGVGSLLVALARRAGVRVIAAASKAKHAALAADGVDLIDYANEDVLARTRALSDGGVIAAFDHIGGRHVRRISLPALRSAGTAILYGAYDATRGGAVRPFAVMDALFNSRVDAFALFGKCQGLVGYNVQHWRDQRTALYREDLARVAALVADGAITPLIGATFPLTEAAAAQRALERRAVAGKIVLLCKESAP